MLAPTEIQSIKFLIIKDSHSALSAATSTVSLVAGVALAVSDGDGPCSLGFFSSSITFPIQLILLPFSQIPFLDLP